MTKQLTLAIGQFSDKGAKPDNQDCYGVEQPTGNLLQTKGIAAAIADGISSSEHSKQASHACVKGFLADYFSTPESWSVKKSAHQVLTTLNSWLYSQGRNQSERHRGHVTTFSAMVIKSTTAHIFHVGDSRIYRLREGFISQLTADHKTWVSAEKNYLSRAMGVDTHLEIDYSRQALEKNDIYILTTDGVHEYLSADEFLNILHADRRHLDKAAELLVRRARDNGSPDNLSCQLLEIRELPNLNVDDVYQQLLELPFPPALSQGMIIDGYRVVRELHASNRTQLYLAEDSDSGLQFVLKTPSVNFEDDPAYIDRFLREEWIGRRINNQHVMKIYEPLRRRRFLYHISEYIDGITLRQWMHDHPEPGLDQVRDWLKQIARGLQAFHRLEMLHQDLKPENIMLDRSNTIKLVDFGSTKVAGIAEITTPLENSQLLGTKNYMAPEYADNQPGSNRSDIYSLGVIAYEMLSGQLPYGDLPDNWQQRRLSGKLRYRPLNERIDSIPPWVDATLQKAVQPDPLQRYAELSEFIYDLSHPNPALREPEKRPLLERNPLRFWQILCALQLILIGYLLFD